MCKKYLVHSSLAQLGVAVCVGFLLLASVGASSSLASLSPAPAHAVANLQHTPTGTTKLHYEPQSQTLTVSILLSGLAPNSTHPAHIHRGVCTSNGPIVYPLHDVIADAMGQASSTTVIAHVSTPIPPMGPNGWYINVHNGPTLQTPSQAYPLACGEIDNPKHANDVLLFLGPTSAPNQDATGFTQLTLQGNDLTVAITVSGLAPNSTHAAHIHAGNCFNTKEVLYNLSPLTADAKGNATKTVVFHHVSSLPPSGWDVNVHFSTDLSTQTGYDPILCGDVVAA